MVQIIDDASNRLPAAAVGSALFSYFVTTFDVPHKTITLAAHSTLHDKGEALYLSPFSRRAWLRVLINDHSYAPFLIDSGASRTFVSPYMVSSSEVASGVHTSPVSTYEGELNFQVIQSAINIGVGQITLRSPLTFTAKISTDRTPLRLQSEGVLGFNVFKLNTVVLDYPGRQFWMIPVQKH